eukprot:11610063-Karenia_brevis.AAC.1
MARWQRSLRQLRLPSKTRARLRDLSKSCLSVSARARKVLKVRYRHLKAFSTWYLRVDVRCAGTCSGLSMDCHA